MNQHRSARLLAALVSTALLTAVQTGPAQAATSGQTAAGVYFNKDCVSRINCTYYLRPLTTRSVARYLDRHGWTVDAAASLVCFRLPPVYGLACGIAIAIPYSRALPHLRAAAEQGGCFTIRAKLPIARFGSVTADDPNCS
ncbi:hypothetical protein ACIBI9_19505 [Nonomuraea sp. NPDC050451]|uniref:hypothetical protein n=1 Tax=Nonomuraea sp. NPDC050451 TaxID=3364364 RepID=UPI00379DCEC9